MSSLKIHIALVLGFLMLTGGLAQAAPIGPDISVTGSADYDGGAGGFSFVDNATQSGTMTVTVGGTTTITTYGATSAGFLEGSTVGADPLMGTLTDIGDGFGVTGAASGSGATADAEFGIGIDVTMTITNNSPTDIYQVTVGIAFGNAVNSVGTDAYVDSEFTLDSRLLPAPAPGTEEFFTDIKTDTVFGNEVGGILTGGFGGPLSESGTDTLVLTLNPGDSYIVEGDWTMEGGAYEDASSEAFLEDFNVQLTIQDVIPEPATLSLLVIGGLVMLRRRRK